MKIIFSMKMNGYFWTLEWSFFIVIKIPKVQSHSDIDGSLPSVKIISIGKLAYESDAIKSFHVWVASHKFSTTCFSCRIDDGIGHTQS